MSVLDRTKVIKGLGEALTLLAEYVPGERYLGYAPGACLDAIELLKAQEPRVITLEEVHMHEVYWIEQSDVARPWPTAMHHIRNAGLLDGPTYQDYFGKNLNTKEYGKTWRCWTSRPTTEQREATPWE